ncbi:MAG: phosphopantothenoylcysteine decarboxylase [Planctomycetota bacterium]|nr:phosphopantothenoylcysteine decarboxylase [Planctomycetota bacterium]
MSVAPRILITAGPTHEPIDEVRFLGNRSSGRLGISLARAAASRGCRTTLLLGPTALAPDDSELAVLRFQSCADLQELLHQQWPGHDVLYMAAAVADYRPREVLRGGKLRRRPGELSLDLVATPDLLAELADHSRPDQLRIGWALEPREGLLESARTKLERKRLDAIVANPLETLDADGIEPLLVLPDGAVRTPGSGTLPKAEFAGWLLDTTLGMLVDG